MRVIPGFSQTIYLLRVKTETTHTICHISVSVSTNTTGNERHLLWTSPPDGHFRFSKDQTLTLANVFSELTVCPTRQQFVTAPGLHDHITLLLLCIM